jgi:hypothetical protein
MHPLLFQVPTPVPIETVVIAKSWLQLIEQYGVMSVLLVVLFMFLYIQYRDFKKEYNKMFKFITDIKEAVPNPKDEDIGRIARLSMTIKAILKEAQVEFGCSWVHLWQYHDGVRTPGLARIPLMFASLTYEIYAPDADSVQVQFEKVPISMIETVVNFLHANPLYVEKATEEGVATNPITKVMFSLGAKKVDFIQVLDAEGKPDAMLSLIWKEDQNFSDDEHNRMKAYATRVSIALANYSEASE